MDRIGTGALVFIILVVAVVFSVTGVVVGQEIGKKQTAQASYDKGYKEGKQEAEKKAKTSNTKSKNQDLAQRAAYSQCLSDIDTRLAEASAGSTSSSWEEAQFVLDLREQLTDECDKKHL